MVTPAAVVTIGGRDFIVFLLYILCANHKLCLWYLTSRYLCSLDQNFHLNLFFIQSKMESNLLNGIK